MKSLREIAGSKRFDVLGGMTVRENFERWRAQEGVLKIARGEVPKQPSPEEAAAALHDHLLRVGAPEHAAQILERGPKQTEAIRAVGSWFDSGKSLLLLHGVTGGGKTIAACSAFLRMRKRLEWDGGFEDQWASRDCAFIEAAELARLGYFDEDAKSLLDFVGRTALLVLDDLGVEMMSESWRATLEALLVKRTDARKRTILTTNVSTKRPTETKPSPFEERYGARLARRVREEGEVCNVTGKP